jgi:hypothetical protein
MLRAPRAAALLITLFALPELGCGGSKVANASSPPPAAELVKNPRRPRGNFRRTRLLGVAPGPPPAPSRVVTMPLHVDPPKPSVEAQNLFMASLTQAPAPLAATGEPRRVIALGLDATARGEALGMKAAGPSFGMALKEGGHARLPVAMAAGSCVTFVGQGGLGVVELDLFLTTRVDGVVRIVAEDLHEGPIAVIGGMASCIEASAPFDGELYIQLRKGEGEVYARRYER